MSAARVDSYVLDLPDPAVEDQLLSIREVGGPRRVTHAVRQGFNQTVTVSRLRDVVQSDRGQCEPFAPVLPFVPPPPGRYVLDAIEPDGPCTGLQLHDAESARTLTLCLPEPSALSFDVGETLDLQDVPHLTLIQPDRGVELAGRGVH
ncbi:MAG: hypothetical protein AAF602_03235 [Myxococcota bacterium]